jgi:hypothetical protein
MTILYDGIGCNENHVHTEHEFLDIMIRSFVQMDWNHPENIEYLHFLRECLQEANMDRRIPEDFPLFTLEDWLQFAGGIRIDN